ncbi:TPA: chloride channel protein, partial [Haemophilus influenzae]
KLFDFGLELNAHWSSKYPVAVWFVLPLGMGGIFTSSLTTGTGIGTMLWDLSGGMVDQRFLVILCMAAFLAGCTQSPVTASVVVMEMTGAQPVLIWLLISSIIASIISHQFSPKPFYHFAAGCFRQQMQARQAEELRSKTEQEK